MPRQRKPIKTPGLHRPRPWRDGEDPIPCFTPKPPPQDGDPVPDELDDAGISLDYDPVERGGVMAGDEGQTDQPRVTVGFTAKDRRALRILAAKRGYPSLSAMIKADALTNLKNARTNGFEH